MNLPKTLIICWSIILSTIVFSSYELITNKAFFHVFGKTLHHSGLSLLYSTAAYVFLTWGVGCILISLACWVVDHEAKRLNAPEKTKEEWVKGFLKEHGVETTK